MSSSSIQEQQKFDSLVASITHRAYVGGVGFVSLEAEGRCFDVHDPFTGGVVGRCGDCGEAEARLALGNAVSCFENSWKSSTVGERYDRLKEWARLVREGSEEISRLLTVEQGKSLNESRGEVSHGANMIEWFAEEARRTSAGELMAARRPERQQDDFVVLSPVGVVFAVTPWNFPFLAPVVKCACAIAAGCTTILKPSEETPLVALALARCADAAGLNEGQISVLPCRSPASVSDLLMGSPKVRMVTFTGSTAVGKKLLAASSQTVKRTHFELGGNAPFVVFDDADLELATKCARGARFYNNGQICLGANRIFVQSSVYDAFVELYKSKVAALRTGNGLDTDSVDTGPLINAAGLRKVQRLLEDAVDRGAKIECGGNVVAVGTGCGCGLNFEPTVVSGATKEMDAYREEVFGPVAFVYGFETEAEVLASCNDDTEAGLAAYVFTRDTNRLWRFAASMEAGMVGANTTDVTAEYLPFGGIKQSGYGKEGGTDCLLEFSEKRVLCIGR